MQQPTADEAPQAHHTTYLSVSTSVCISSRRDASAAAFALAASASASRLPSSRLSDAITCTVTEIHGGSGVAL